MRLAVLVALSLCLAGVALVAAAPAASACIPPNCPGYVTCKPRDHVEVGDLRVPTGYDCYY